MQDKIIVALDADGGDFSWDVTVPAAIKAIKKYPDLHLKLFGNAAQIEKKIGKNSKLIQQFEIINATEKINTDDSPIAAMRKKGSSMYLAFNALCNQQADAMVSAGSTSTMVMLASKIKIDNVSRIGIMAALPKINGQTYLVDCGASLNSTQKNLLDFAKMGVVCLENIIEIPSPKVGLLNIGHEETKGTAVIQETHAMLLESNINYMGYMEPFDFYSEEIDLIVANGMEGNIMLKSLQAAFKFMLLASKKPVIDQLSKPYWLYMSYLRSKYWYRGGYLLGTKKNIIKTHGSASCTAMLAAIRDARKYAIKSVDQKIQAYMKNI